MKWIKEFCLEILNKVKENVVAAIALALIAVMSIIFKKYLTTVCTLALPLWIWILIFAAILCLPAIILRIINRWRRQEVFTNEEVLTDKDDIFNKLHWWVGQQLDFVREETKNNKLITRHSKVIDDRLSPGSAKNFLPAMFSAKPKAFEITIVNEGKETIALRYDHIVPV
ncbi:MAG: hypothetical protein ACYTFQ_10070 [Planctomycetota bacterium]|jgi:hypothetical protein